MSNERPLGLLPISLLGGSGLLIALMGLSWSLFVPDSGEAPERTPHQIAEPSASRIIFTDDLQRQQKNVWLDPFHDVEPIVYQTTEGDQKQEARDDAQSSKTLTKLRNRTLHLLKAKGELSPKVMLMPVLCESGTSQINGQGRARTRHSVEIALSSQSFNPQRDGFLDIVTLPVQRKTAYGLDRVQLRIPFSEYSDGLNHVIVFWIQTGLTGEQPLNAILQIADAFVPPESELNKPQGSDVFQASSLSPDPTVPGNHDDRHWLATTPVRDSGQEPASKTNPQYSPQILLCINGPTSSDTLREMIDEFQQIDPSLINSPSITSDEPGPTESDTTGAGSEPMLSYSSNLTKYNGGVTILNSDCTALNSTIGLPKKSTRINNSKLQTSLRLIHTIGEDQALISLLENELKSRGVFAHDGQESQILLFVEQGSASYIRDLQDRFTRGFDGASANEVIVVPYLKGMSRLSRASRSEGNDDVSIEDYLDRTMEELNLGIRQRGFNPNLIRAIGIFGGEWEDKNLILKKVRRAFPLATFFTTELDARYCLPENVPHCRNLIVASHYGLRIEGQFQYFGFANNIPSFREGYQTARFISTSIALYAFRDNVLSGDKTKQEHLIKDEGKKQDLFDICGRAGSRKLGSESATLSPLVFEIGTRTPVQLTKPGDSTGMVIHQPRGVRSLHQQRDLIWRWFLFLTLLIGAIPLFAPYSSDIARLWDSVTSNARMVGKSVHGIYRRGFVTAGSTNDESGRMIDQGQEWSPAGESLVARPTDATTDRGTFFLLSFICLSLALYIYCDFRNSTEPVLFSNGVSLWPAIYILTVVVILCWYSLLRYRRILPRPRTDTTLPYYGNADFWDHDKKTSQFDMRPKAIPAAIVATLLLGLISFVDQGLQPPPARDWLVRGIAFILLWMAIGFVLAVVLNAALFAVTVREIIKEKRTQLLRSFRRFDLSESERQELTDEEKEQRELELRRESDVNDQQQIAEIQKFYLDCRGSMRASIAASGGLIRPSLLALLFVIARMPHWDSWGLTLSSAAILAVPILLACFTALLVRLKAIEFRDRVIEKLVELKFRVANPSGKTGGGGFHVHGQSAQTFPDDAIDRIDQALQAIQRLNRGPYGPISQDWLLGGVFLVISVIGSGPVNQLLEASTSYLP